MFLSQIKLDLTRREVQRVLSSRERIHAALQGGFETSGRILWRLDHDKILIVSDSEPDPIMKSEYLLGLGEFSIKSYDSFLSSIKNEKQYRFRLTANPVHSVPTENGKHKIYAHVTIAQQEEWLRSRSEKLGVAFHDFKVTASNFEQFYKGKAGDRVTIKLATYDGILTIKNQEMITAAMINGIGRAKAYGTGLLTLIPYNSYE